MAQQILNPNSTQPNDKLGDTPWDYTAKINSNFSQLFSNNLDSVIVVNQANAAIELGGVIDSTKTYLIDGKIDMGSVSITVPAGGIVLSGYSLNTSGLFSSADNYTMFVSESIAIGSGDVLGADFYMSVTGNNSKIYNLYSSDSFGAIEFYRINYIDCTSLGDLYDYRQGLEEGTGRFGGSPALTLHGIWLGGFRISTSIVRGLSAGMTGALFQEGVLFEMRSRFLTDINCDLPASAALIDFSPRNLPNSSTLQLKGCEITRGGSYDASDASITPNVANSDLCSYWKQNNGLINTFVGGNTSITSEATTVISAASTYYDLGGVFFAGDLQHFSGGASGTLTHLGANPIEFEITSSLVIEGSSNNEITVRFVKWEDSTSTFVNLDYTAQTRQINNLQGGRDVAYFTILTGTTLKENDYLKIQVRNNSATSNVTAETGSFYRIQER